MKDAHILGYLRELDRESLPFLDKSRLYRAGELIGWQGLEKQYENELRYSKGIEYIEVDTYGRKINRINDNNIPAPKERKYIFNRFFFIPSYIISCSLFK